MNVGMSVFGWVEGCAVIPVVKRKKKYKELTISSVANSVSCLW